jgi:predicted alpha/beta superfamily hydrolase
MKKYEFGRKNAPFLLVQTTDESGLYSIDSEIEIIRKITEIDFRLFVFTVDDWNRDLSPYNAQAVFRGQDFGNGGQETLDAILKELKSISVPVFIGGYSLSGLFALWSACRCNAFSGVAAASPSVWFPGFTDYMQTNTVNASKVYLSLGKKEPASSNPVLASVGDCMEKAQKVLAEKNVECFFEWNEGGHFRDPELRTAKAFSWLLENTRLYGEK